MENLLTVSLFSTSVTTFDMQRKTKMSFSSGQRRGGNICLQKEVPCPECKYAWFLVCVLSRFVFATVSYKCWGWLKLDRHPACLTSFSKQSNDNQIVRMVGDSCARISMFR